MAKDTANPKKEKKHFLKEFKAELKKVIWPTPKQIVNSTIAVITIVLLTAVIVFVLDLTFEGLNKYGINKLRDVVKKDETENFIDDVTNIEDGIELDLNEQSIVDDGTLEDQEVAGEKTADEGFVNGDLVDNTIGGEGQE